MKINAMTKRRRFLVPLICGLLIPATTLPAQDGGETVHELEAYPVITTTRMEKSLGSIPQTITVLDHAQWSGQLDLSADPIAALSQLLPSYSPSRQKMTGFGETFRGRSPLFMVNGVPQSNPLRDGSRDGYTVGSPVIERIEIIHGASAAQGLGATGGIINFITIAPPAEDGWSTTLRTGLESGDKLDSSGTGYSTDLTTRMRSGKFGAALSAGYAWRPMAYDGDGRLVGIDNTQGDTMNSATLNLFSKFNYSIDPDQTVSLMVNRFDMEQDLEYVAVPGDFSRGVPTGSRKGSTEGDPARNDVLSVDAAYENRDLLGNSLKVDAFYQDFSATYGGGTFGVFQLDGVPVFDQSRNESRKQGLKVAFAGDLGTAGSTGFVTGIDYIEDETRQSLVQTGRVWVPESTYRSLAPYLQVEQAFGRIVLSGGLRHESAELDVPDFVSLEFYGSREVGGASPDFTELLANIGLTLETRPGETLFLSYSQGFGMPDVGRVLRAINQPGLEVGDFLNLQPVVTDNFEIGLRRNEARFSGSLSLFYSDSKLGSRLVADADGIFSVNREATATYGLEARAKVRLDSRNLLDFSFAAVEGKFDSDGDGSPEQRLDGTNIPPVRINLGWNAQWSEVLSTRLQGSTLFDRTDPSGRSQFDFGGYSLVDLLVEWRLPRGRLTFGLSNLLDKTYFTYYSQVAGNDTRNFTGRGRSLSVRYELTF